MKAKRILGLIMTFLLCFNLMIAVFAEGEEQKIITTADEVRAFMADLVVGASQNTDSRIGSIQKNAYARISGVDFGEGVYNRLEVRYGVDDANAGGTMYVYIDSMESEPVTELKLPSTGGFGTLKTIGTDINLNISGVHSVYVKFGQAAMCNLFGLSFLGGSASGIDAWPDSEVAGIASKLEGLGITNLGDIISPDKPVTNANVLAVARKISPYFNMSDTEFCKKNAMTLNDNAKDSDILTVFSSVAGYDRIGTYSAYFRDLDIFKNVKFTDGSIIGKEFLKCIDNFLNAKVLKVGTNANSFYQSEETVMNVCLDIYETKGIVLSDDYTSIVGSVPSQDDVKIGNEIYNKNGVDVNAFLGKNVKVYYRERSSEYFLVYIEPLENDELVLESGDVEGFGSLTLTYTEPDTNRKKTAKVAQDYVLIYNGIVISEFEETLFNTFNGNLKLIDNDHDRKYDVLIMTDTVDVLIETVSREIIYGRGGYSLKLEDKDYVIKDQSGNKMSGANLDILKKNNIVSIGHVIGADGSELYTLIVSTKTVTGYVSARSFVTTSILEIDGVKYEYSEFAEDNSDSLLGLEATIYLNAKGKIAFAEAGVKAEDVLFGYAEKYNYNENDEKIFITIFAADESIQRYECSSSLRVDGKRYKNISKVKSALDISFKKGIVTYVTDEENNLLEIDFPYNYIGFENPDNYGWERENSLYLSYDGSSSSVRYKKDVRGFCGKTLDNDKTLVFFIPEDGEIEDYRVKNVSYLTHDNSYKAKAYGTSANDYYSNVYEITQNVGATISEMASTYFVVNVNLNSLWDEASGEIYSTIEYFANGTKVTSKVNPQLNDTVKDLTCGDAIRFATDQNGNISAIEKRYDVETGTVINTENTGNAFHHYVRVMKETIRTIDNGIAFLDGIEEIANLNTSNIVIYDSTIGGTRCLEAATVKDIVPGDEIFISQYYGNIKGIMILR